MPYDYSGTLKILWYHMPTCILEAMHPFCVFLLTILTCALTLGLAQRATSATLCLEGSVMHSLLKRAMHLATLPDREDVLNGPLGVVVAYFRQWDIISSLVSGAVPPADRSPEHAGITRPQISLRWVRLKLRRLFVKTSMNVLRRKVSDARWFPPARGVFGCSAPKMSTNVITTLLAV